VVQNHPFLASDKKKVKEKQLCRAPETQVNFTGHLTEIHSFIHNSKPHMNIFVFLW
jgi:hypothetical protein